MAAPNIVNVSAIYGKTVYLTPANTTANVLLSNAASSGKVLKVNFITAANVNGSTAVNATASINSNASGTGTNYPIGSTISVPASAALIMSDKTTAIYLEEDRSIVVTAGTSSGITFSLSYEDIS